MGRCRPSSSAPATPCMQAMPQRRRGRRRRWSCTATCRWCAPTTLRAPAATAARGGLALLTAELADPTGYGRIVRDAAGRRARASSSRRTPSPAERAIREINTGFMALSARAPRRLARQARQPQRAAGVLPDRRRRRWRSPTACRSTRSRSTMPWEVAGVNRKRELAAARARRTSSATRARLLEAGVTLADPARIDVRGDARLRARRRDRRQLRVRRQGDARRRRAHRRRTACCATSRSAPAAEVLAVLASRGRRRSARAAASARTRGCGRARARRRRAHRQFRRGQGEPHRRAAPRRTTSPTSATPTSARSVNVGAGTITCNYDGADKHRTVIEDDCFIGSRRDAGGAGAHRARAPTSAPARRSARTRRPGS